ncbi:hypothetical protein LEP1GSC081_4281 [Leptospira kirschneri str. H1]|uniref:Uncharacterized protein n=1 Tax=Leptospira kirschneri str. H1 TaxID=1049966 RepID=A0A0E2B902_9LEPT|nr:hypothetical protein LEP1GSC081_4281 [Leptospira kirschneri str. H1]
MSESSKLNFEQNNTTKAVIPKTETTPNKLTLYCLILFDIVFLSQITTNTIY